MPMLNELRLERQHVKPVGKWSNSGPESHREVGVNAEIACRKLAPADLLPTSKDLSPFYRLGASPRKVLSGRVQMVASGYTRKAADTITTSC